MNPHRASVLAELGLVRYRLRGAPVGVGVAGSVSATESAAPAKAVSAEPNDAAGPAHVEPASRPVAILTVHVPDTGGEPVTSGAAAQVWRQVLTWLRLDERDVAWSSTPTQPACVLPASHEWSTPQGKRGLWLALKAFAVTRAV